jgi:hypothetical protein
MIDVHVRDEKTFDRVEWKVNNRILSTLVILALEQTAIDQDRPIFVEY